MKCEKALSRAGAWKVWKRLKCVGLDADEG